MTIYFYIFPLRNFAFIVTIAPPIQKITKIVAKIRLESTDDSKLNVL